MTGRQVAVLWYGGLWRALVGLPLAVTAAVFAWSVPLPSQAFPNFFVMAMMIGFAGLGAYLCFTAFSFLGDAITRNVSYITGRLGEDVRTYRGSKSYYMVIGPVRTRILRKKKFEALPFGLQCHVYYASGSLHLLSLEPATASEPHPSLRFGGDSLHAWDRLRWSWLVPAVAIFGLAAGVHAMVSAHPATTSLVSGRISEYHETHGKGAGRYFHLDGSSVRYDLRSFDGSSLAPPALSNFMGDQVDLYVNSEQNTDVLAMRLRQQLYTSDLYLHPENQTWATVTSGAPIALISGAVLALSGWGMTRLRKRRAKDQTSPLGFI